MLAKSKDVKETIINYKTKGVVLNSVKDSVDIDNYEDLIKLDPFRNEQKNYNNQRNQNY